MQTEAKIVKNLDAVARPLIQQLICYFSCVSDKQGNQYIADLCESYVNYIPKTVSYRKLTANQIYRILWVDVEDEFNSLYLGALDTQLMKGVAVGSELDVVAVSKLKQLCATYLNWLAEELANKDYVLRQTISTELEELIRNQS